MTEYRQYLVTYYDILGFRSLIETGSEASLIRAILRLLQTSSAPSRAATNVQFTSFSDLVVRSVPIVESALCDAMPILLQEIYDVIFAQTEILRYKSFVRGAASLGLLCADVNALFGPALLEAYDLERTQACYPRIVLSRPLRDIITSCSAAGGATAKRIEELLTVDVDGWSFVNYLHGRRISCHDTFSYLTILMQHRDAIRAAVDRYQRNPNPSLENKINWLTHYHTTLLEQIPEALFDGVTLHRQVLRV